MFMTDLFIFETCRNVLMFYKFIDWIFPLWNSSCKC